MRKEKSGEAWIFGALVGMSDYRKLQWATKFLITLIFFFSKHNLQVSSVYSLFSHLLHMNQNCYCHSAVSSHHFFIFLYCCTSAIVSMQILICELQEVLDSIQGYFGFQDPIQHPRKIIEGKNEHPDKGQSCKNLRWREKN